ncbi:hypothetical protein RUM43_002153 [Polyplax serrata]|uniref:Uncharacterized protein n=1 Tax=Polyplax serrata TaxID=468196 RepID=A0AAN8S956_POLSC
MTEAKSNFYVPWADHSEWDGVRKQIASWDATQFIQGYETILMWKLKHHSLPAFVESTLSILHVMIKEHRLINGMQNLSLPILEEQDLRMACSMALIRFVNHVSSVANTKGESLYLSAKTQNIPDWIINMRHEAAHSQDLPTLEAFHSALKISLKWLLDNYWMKERGTSKEISTNSYEGNINAVKLFTKIFDIWDLCFENKQIYIRDFNKDVLVHLEEFHSIRNKHFSEIKLNEVLQLENIRKTYHLVEKASGDLQKELTVKQFKTALLKFLEKALKIESNKKNFISSVLDSSFLKDKHLKFRKWRKILEIVHKAKLLESLISELFEKSGEGHEKAAKWLAILYPSIKLLRKKWAMYKVIRKQNKTSHYKMLKKQVRIMENNMNKRFLVSFELSKPPTITLEMMTALLMNPEAMQTAGLLQYLKMVKPTLPESTILLIKSLVNSTQGRGHSNIESTETIYTMEDLKSIMRKGTTTAHNSAYCDEGGRESDTGWTKSKIGVLKG